jgi:hypothetical protein
LHGTSEERRWAGRADVRRGTGLLARAIARMFGFPQAGERVPVTVTLSPEPDGGERWTRDFGGKKFHSVQSRGRGRDDYLLVERFGKVRVSLALVVDGERLYLVPRRWSWDGLPLPRSLLPAGLSFEREVGGKFGFDVEISGPVTGLIIGYRGTLSPQPC